MADITEQINQAIAQSQQQAAFGVSLVPFHTHNGIDSPNLKNAAGGGVNLANSTGVLPIANGGTNTSSPGIGSFNNTTGFTASGTTGTTSTNLVFSTSPTLVTPILGAATVTSLTAATNTSINMVAGTYNTIQTYTPTAAGTATLDLSKGNIHSVTFPAGNITLVFSNTNAGQCFLINLTQDSGGSRTTAWPSGIKWSGGSAPVLTLTASKIDTIGIQVVTAGSAYLGYLVGANA